MVSIKPNLTNNSGNKMISRKLIISIHLTLAAFFAPILLIIGISGGLYLIGVKGSVQSEQIYQGATTNFDFQAKDQESQIRQFIQANDIDHEFEYVKTSGRTSYTRPTSRQHLTFQKEGDQLTVNKRTPNLVASMIELHKGHGPTILKTFQQLTAIGFFLILISGLYLGITSPAFKNKTLLISGLGLLSFLIFAVI